MSRRPNPRLQDVAAALACIATAGVGLTNCRRAADGGASASHRPAPTAGVTLDAGEGGAQAYIQPPAVDVPTQHNDNARTGANLSEVVLSPATVTSDRFGRLFAWRVHGQQYAQPLYVSNLTLADGRVVDLVIVATMDNYVQAFEVPPKGQKPKAEALWTVDSGAIGAPLPFNFTGMGPGPVLFGHNVWPSFGITSTPVIDRELGLLYACAKAKNTTTGLPTHYLVAIDLKSGALTMHQEIPVGAVVDDCRSSGKGFACHQLQRPALLEANGKIYVAFGGHEDHPPYQGRIYAYDRKTLAQASTSFSTLPPGVALYGGGIWQAGGGLASDAATATAPGNIYAITGNTTQVSGAHDGSGEDSASSFIRLGPDLDRLGSWTPSNWLCQDTTDADLGSAGPLFDGVTGTLLGGGKEGVLYALRPSALQGSHWGEERSELAGKPCDRPPSRRPKGSGAGYTSLQAAPPFEPNWWMDAIRWFEPYAQMMGYHHIHGSPVMWRPEGETPRVYLSAERDVLRAFKLVGDGELHGSAPGDVPVSSEQSVCRNSAHGMPGGFLSLSADGSRRESGLVWVSMPRWNYDALHHVAPGVLRVFRALPSASGSSELAELWNSDEGHAVAKTPQECGKRPSLLHDSPYQFAKFAAPTVARGRVYLPTFSDELIVYGLRDEAKEAGTPENLRGKLSVTVGAPEVAPGAVASIDVVASNDGTDTWRVGDGLAVRCEALGIRGSESRPFRLDHDVPVRGTASWKLQLIMPETEGEQYVRCTLGGDRSPAGVAGDVSAEIAVSVLRPDCRDLRQRRDEVLAQFTPDAGLPATIKSETERLRAEAEKRECFLGVIGAHER